MSAAKKPKAPERTRKLGMRLPSRWTDRDHRRAKFLDPSKLPPIPASFDWSTALPAPEIDDNDRLGNCTCASIAHLIETVTALNGSRVVATVQQVDALYAKVNGGRDNGANMGDVLDRLETDGLAGVKVIGRAMIDATNDAQVAAAMFLFGGVYAGGTVYQYCLSSKTWDKSTPPVAGGHAFYPAVWPGLSAAVKAASWDDWFLITQEFRKNNIDEMYAVLTDRHVSPKTGLSWHGFSLAQLFMFLMAGFGGSPAPGVVVPPLPAPTPVPVPVPTPTPVPPTPTPTPVPVPPGPSPFDQFTAWYGVAVTHLGGVASYFSDKAGEPGVVAADQHLSGAKVAIDKMEFLYAAKP